MAQLEPFAPYNTEEYILAQKQLGATPFVLGLYQGETMVAGCAAFLISGWLGKRVWIPSFPALPETEQFFAGLSEFCRHHRVWQLVLGSFGSSKVVLPTIGRLLEKQNRFEFIIELNNLDSLKLSSNHKRNINRARKAGVAFKRTSEPNAIAPHLELMGASMARREARSENVSGVIKESVMRAMLEAAVGEFFQAYAGAQILSSIFIMKSLKVGYYHSAGTSPKGMELGASPFLVYSAAELLSEDGFRELNLGGAEPENPGLYRFKKGFGAVERRLEAAIFSLVPPILYWAHSALRLMRRDPKGFLRRLIPVEHYVVYCAELQAHDVEPLPKGIELRQLSDEELLSLEQHREFGFSAGKRRVLGFNRAWGLYVGGELAHIAWLIDEANDKRNLVRNLKLRADEAEITHCVTGLQFRGKGFYPLLVRQLSAIAFRCGITKLFMMTSSGNHASQRGIEKAGLQRRGSIRLLRLPCLSAHASLTWRGHRLHRLRVAVME